MISALITGWWREVADAIEAGRVELIISPQAIDEFIDVTTRPAKRSLLDPEDAAEIGDLLRRAALFVPGPIESVCRDPSDDFLLALAKEGNADVLVSRDEDLLSLKEHGRTEIIHVAAFLDRISS